MTTSIGLPDLALSNSHLSVDEIEAQTIAAYDRLAPEYDSEEHATTRKLERLSIDACADLLRRSPAVANIKRVLEIGCGTGALSSLLLELVNKDVEFIFTDASASMLSLLQAKLEGLKTPRSVKQVQLPILSDQEHSQLGKFDLVVCGMADPYFFGPAMDNIRQYCAQGAHLIVTLPEKSWAEAERQYRLKVPVNQTRFRLLTGEVVMPFSFVYSEEELKQLLRGNDFDVLEINIKSEPSSHQKAGHPLPVSVIGVMASAV
jgi:SAM-dependent methyltransferase